MMEEEKVKRKVLASLLVIAVVAGLVGAGTWAYFSDTGMSSENAFTAGTIDLQLRNDEVGDWGDGVTATWSSPNWAPGDPEVVAELRMKNIGTTGALTGRICAENLVEINNGTAPAEPAGGGANNIADHIYITTLEYTEDGSTYVGGAGMLGWYESIFGDGDGTFTLRELFTKGYCMVFWTGTGNPGDSGVDYLPAGGNIQKFKIGFTFEQDAGNDYQSDKATFDLRVVASDDPAISGKGSAGCYGY